MNLDVKNWFKSTAFGRFLRNKYQRRGFYSKKLAKQYIIRYLGETDSCKNELVTDMLHEAQKYNVGFDEYLMYHFYDLSSKERREFVPTRERIKYCEKLNDPKNMIIFDDKAKTYEHYKKYYKRDFANFSLGTGTQADFMRFVKKHPKFIVKPYAGANGIGIQIIDSQTKDTAELFKDLNNQYKCGFYLEELIIQDEQLGKFHPFSVNTLRLFTVRMDDRIEFLPAAWRVGQGRKIVDNGGSGGIFCALNDQGIVYQTSDELGKSYEKHPTSGLELIGFQVPKFEEAKSLARELAGIIPSNRYTGWDLALTKDGWIMQEGNDRGGVVAFQLPMRKGCRKLLDDIMAELNL